MTVQEASAVYCTSIWLNRFLWIDELVSVRVKTGPTAEDELNAATFKVEVCSVTLETKCCTIDFLDNPKHDDFKSNALDTFAGDALKGCKGFDFERESVFVKVSINGVDAWGGYWVDLEDKEGFTVRCVQNPRQQLFYLRRSEYNLDCNILGKLVGSIYQPDFFNSC